MTAAFFLTSLGAVAITVHLVPFLTDRGYDPGFAASMVGLIGIMALPGRLVFTMLGERVPRSLVAALLFGLQSLALVVLLLAPGTFGVVLFVILFGIGFGAITPARAALVAQYYGHQYYGSISGMLSLFITGARGLAPFGIGLAFELLKSYLPVWWVLAFFSGLAVVAIFLAETSQARLKSLELVLQTEANN